MAKSRSRSPKRSAKRSPKRSVKRSPSKMQGYCVVCGKKVNISGGKMTKTCKGQPMFQGKCPHCGTKVSRFVSRN